MSKYQVIGRPLRLNGRRRKVGAKIEMGDQDAAVLIRLGRIAPEQAKSPAPRKAPAKRAPRRRRAAAPPAE